MSGTSGAPGRGAQTVTRVRLVAGPGGLAALPGGRAVPRRRCAADRRGRQPDNDLVKFVLEGADRVDLGIFSKDNGIKEFSGANAETKNALFNWGLGAVVWLVVGRILDRLIRP